MKVLWMVLDVCWPRAWPICWIILFSTPHWRYSLFRRQLSYNYVREFKMSIKDLSEVGIDSCLSLIWFEFPSQIKLNIFIFPQILNKNEFKNQMLCQKWFWTCVLGPPGHPEWCNNRITLYKAFIICLHIWYSIQAKLLPHLLSLSSIILFFTPPALSVDFQRLNSK